MASNVKGKIWYRRFSDSQYADEVDLSLVTRSEALERFVQAAKANVIDGRELLGMWLVDHGTEQEDVIAIHGRIPGDIRARFDAYQRRAQAGK
jgi:hypothetical protein